MRALRVWPSGAVSSRRRGSHWIVEPLEARKLLSQMPHLKAQQDIRKLYQQLADGDITTKALEEKRETIVASSP